MMTNNQHKLCLWVCYSRTSFLEQVPLWVIIKVHPVHQELIYSSTSSIQSLAACTWLNSIGIYTGGEMKNLSDVSDEKQIANFADGSNERSDSIKESRWQFFNLVRKCAQQNVLSGEMLLLKAPKRCHYSTGIELQTSDHVSKCFQWYDTPGIDQIWPSSVNSHARRNRWAGVRVWVILILSRVSANQLTFWPRRFRVEANCQFCCQSLLSWLDLL